MLTLGHKYSYLFILAVGFVLGIYFSSLFSGCGRHATSVPSVTIVKADILQNQVARVQATYQGKIDSLGASARILQGDLQATHTALDKVKHKNLVLQTQVYDLLDRTATAGSDTIGHILDCDSLQSKVKDLVINDNLKDSLYEQEAVNWQEQVNNKDSVIHVQENQNHALESSFTQALQQQQSLQVENTALRKSVRHQKIKGTLRTIGMVVVGMLAAHYLTH